MPRKSSRLLVLLVLPLLLPIPGTSQEAIRTDTNPDRAWQSYLKNDTDLAPSYQFPYAHCFVRAANAYGIPQTLLLAVARGESDFEATAKSHANAYGVMQILWPATANHLGIQRLSDLYDPCTNIDAGARYLKELLTRYSGNIHLSLAAYNYGPQRISTDGQNIPAGASWYSSYILRHLNYVLGERKATKPPANTFYSDLGRSDVISFAEPYRAAAFIARMEQHSPELKLDWFRRDVGKFIVVLSYRDRNEFSHGANLLKQAGFALN